MSPTHTRKGNRLYRYYVSQDVLQHGRDACPIGGCRRRRSRRPSSISCAACSGSRRSSSARGARRGPSKDDVTEDEAREALPQLDPLWDELFPAEQGRIVQLLVDRVDVHGEGVDVRFRMNGIGALARETTRRAA